MDQDKKQAYIKSYQKAGRDKEIMAIAEERLADYLALLDKVCKEASLEA